jgi:pilus assembly protein CpaC
LAIVIAKRMVVLGCIGVLSLGGILLGQEPAAAPPAPQASENASTGASQVVHILVGHTVMVRTDTRLKRVLVGNPAVVNTTTTAPNELAITASAPGSSSVVLWQEDNSSRIVEVYSDVDVSMLRDAIRTSFPRELVAAEAEEGKVVLTGTASSQTVIDQIGKMAAPFAKDLVNSVHISQARQRQVLVKVKFAEIDRTKLDQFGINILSTGAANTPGAISTQQFGNTTLGTAGGLTGTIGAGNRGTTTTETVSNLLNVFLFRPDLNLGATISDLQQKNVVQILAEPNLLATDGQPATFLAGGELPYPVVTGAGGQSTVSVQFKPFGVKLEFTGTIEADDVIRLKVYPEVSTLDYANAVTLNGFVLPAITTRNATTVVELKSGQSFGIAGLLDRRTTATFAKMPGIGDIPILGQLFRSRSINKVNTELMVIVTPIIVDPASEQGSAPPEVPKQPMKPLDPAQFDSKIPASGGK